MTRHFNVYWDVGGLNLREYNYNCTIEDLHLIIDDHKVFYPEWTLIKVEEWVSHTLEIDIEEFE